MMSEVWVDIPDTDGKLQVSNHGNIRSSLRGAWKVLKAQADNKGYLRVTYVYKKEKRRVKVHRLVALMFVPADPFKNHVNHINGDKTDNRAINLEWCTNQENAHHAIKNGLWDSVIEGAKRVNDARKRAVLATNIKSGSVTRFISVSDAERACNTKHVCAVMSGERRKANGYIFKYADS